MNTFFEPTSYQMGNGFQASIESSKADLIPICKKVLGTSNLIQKKKQTNMLLATVCNKVIYK